MAKSTRPLGHVQREVLRCLVEHRGYWHGGCFWTWSNFSETVRIMEGLERRGLVTKTLVKGYRSGFPGHRKWTLTQAGRDEGGQRCSS